MTARTYSEQLVAEWLELDGWYVKTGVPLFTSNRSRGEADIVAVKMLDGHLHVCHVEVGHIANSAKDDLKMVQDKTTSEIKAAIKKDVKDTIGGEPEYSFRYIAMTPGPTSYKTIRDEGLRIDLFNDVVNDEVVPCIRNWVDGHKTKNGNHPTPPSNMWMIQLLYRLMYYGVNLMPFYDNKLSNIEE